MSPIEGCPSPTVFQVTCSLSPGYHQFKFFVDDKWRHDERQLGMFTGNYGVVNTVFIARELDVVAPSLIHEASSRSNMDVDVFIRSEPIPTISDADLEASRHRIADFLSRHTAYELLPDSGKVHH